VNALSRRVEQARAEVAAARGKHPSLDLAMAVGEHDKSSAGGLLSAALAFRLFLWILPAALVGVGVLGFFEPGDAA
jgi:uncharacterized BrkB/YihY/UPF0761 family membrane protein